MRIEIWSDVACPWCYIGKRRFEAALSRFPRRDRVEVVWRSFQLDPSLPDRYPGSELDYLAERKGLPRADVTRMFGQVADAARREGLHYDFDRLVVANSLPAHELLHHAAAHGCAGDVQERLMSAHFEQGLDIGDRDQLADIAASTGLDRYGALAALADGRYRAAVEHDVATARQLGIRGVPCLVIDRAVGISGAQPAEVFSDALERSWEAAHPLEVSDDVEDVVDR